MDAKSYTDLAKKLNEQATAFSEKIETLKQLNENLIESTSKVLESLAAVVGTTTLRISCSLCCSAERTTVLLPCAHGGFCHACATRCVRRGRCPTCRSTVETAVRVFM